MKIESYRTESIVAWVYDPPEPGVMLVVREPGDVAMHGDAAVPYVACYRCPCGCDQVVHLPVQGMGEASHRWGLVVEGEVPTLSPSIRETGGCLSHYYIRNGKVEWV